MPTVEQVSAGGVAYRRTAAGALEVAIVAVGTARRWQLPKGLVAADEAPEAAALREVREEAGLETHPEGPLETIEYWYVGTRRGGGRVRFHKFVHFYLLAYRSGDPSRHDREVEEARWVTPGEALAMLAFPGERRVVERALARLAGGGPDAEARRAGA